MMTETISVEFKQNDYGFYFKEVWGSFGSHTQSRTFKTLEECMDAYEKHLQMGA